MHKPYTNLYGIESDGEGDHKIEGFVIIVTLSINLYMELVGYMLNSAHLPFFGRD